MSRFALLNVATLAALGAVWALAPERARLPATVAIAALHLLAFTRGVFSGRSSLFLPVHARGKPGGIGAAASLPGNGRGMVALTFDDGPGDATRALLGVLAEHGAKATFFPIGASVKGREDVLRAAAAAGHTIGSHGFGPSRLTSLLLSSAMTAEAEKGVAAVEAAIGKRPRLHRPPSGLKSPAVAAACRRLDLVCVGWARRARDGGAAAPDVAALVARLVAVKGGEIVLLQGGVEPGRKGGGEATVKALREAIPLLKARGLELTTVDRLLGERPYA